MNIGLGADLARRSNSGARKYLGDFFGTFSSLLVTIAGFKPADLGCIYGGSEKIIKKCYNLSIGITPLIASGIKVPVESGHEKQFYLMGACDLGLSNVFGVIKKVYSGKPFKNNNCLWIEYSEKIEVLNKNSEVEFDGDPQGFSPCSISFASDDLNILVPKKDIDQ